MSDIKLFTLEHGKYFLRFSNVRRTNQADIHTGKVIIGGCEMPVINQPVLAMQPVRLRDIQAGTFATVTRQVTQAL